MAVFKCKMCGGDLTVTEADKVVQCEYCGTSQTVPSADNEKKMTLFNRANRLRMNSEFDKAGVLFEQLVSEFPEEAEAYWGLCLCNWGIEYVDDPATGEKKPTCHRASFEKLVNDENYQLAMEYADIVAQRIYRREAQEIDRINEEILSVSRGEKPYDVFICYKETDENGGRTPDSAMAQDIYDALTAKGFKVFFARITLEDKLGQQYEPYIFAALNSAKVMLCVGTRYEYFHAVWVKNEWSRFLRLAAKDKSKILIPCYRDMDPYDMPDEFKGLQAQDLGKLGAVQDLVRGVEKIHRRDTGAQGANQPQAAANPPVATTDSLLKRAFMFLEDGYWQSADEYAEKVLDIDPENGEAYLAKAMASLKRKTRRELSNAPGINNNPNIKKALRFGSDALKAEINRYISLTKAAEDAHNKAVLEEIARKEAEKEERRKAEEEEAAKKRAHDIVRLAFVRKSIFEAQNMISAGDRHSIGLKSDGTVISTIYKGFYDRHGDQCNVSSWRDIVAIAAGYEHSLGLKADGTVVANERIGSKGVDFGQCEVAGWTDIVAIAAGTKHSLGLKSDGTVISTIHKDVLYSGQCAVSSWRDIVAIAAGPTHSLGLKSDGTVVATEYIGIKEWDCGQCEVAGWTDIVAISAGLNYSLGLKSDGTVVATRYSGDNDIGQCDVESWRDIVAIAAGYNHSLGLKADGTVIATKYRGKDDFGQCDVMGWHDIVAISAGSWHSLGLKSEGTVISTKFKGGSRNYSGQCDIAGWKLFRDAKSINNERKQVKKSKIASLMKEKATLEGELPTLTGLFKGGRRREVQARLAEINAELEQLK